eukprot:CCRYP_007883-RA/>CCRYP_007883-RA protein AED:0.22 eAED:0.22 QI:0/-1/0/1/-1/1/1/0/330
MALVANKASSTESESSLEHHDYDFNHGSGSTYQSRTVETSTAAGQRSQPTKKRTGRPLLKRNSKSSTTARSKGAKTDERARSHNAPRHNVPAAVEHESVPCSNAIDEVLSESDDLLRCAHEAQALGRLNEAQSYLYLAHARLVGLGRFSEQGYVDDEKEDCVSKKGHADSNEAISANNVVGSSSDELKPTLEATTSMLTPHAERLSLKAMITPSPMSTSHLPTIEGSNNLSGYLAQSALNLLYKQKGIERKADQSSRRRSRAKSVDSNLKESSMPQREKIGTQSVDKRGKHESDDVNLSPSCVWSASVMTANDADLDAKVLMQKGLAALR